MTAHPKDNDYSNLEDVFVTEGVPLYTFVSPPNYTAILVDIRRKGKPVIIEGQSGTGKTTTVKKALAEIFPDDQPRILTPREPSNIPIIEGISQDSGDAVFVIDDFHRLNDAIKEKLANLAKMIAERDNRDGLPKLVIIGINNVGSDLIQMVPDIAKRVGIHRVAPGTPEEIARVISLGSERLRISIADPERIIRESRGDYWLTQQLCKTICIANGIDRTQETPRELKWEPAAIHDAVVQNLQHNYDPPVREFCRGRRFRPSNDPYFKLLRAVSEEDRSNIDLNELANSRPDIKGSVNNIKDRRLSVLLSEKEQCARLFYYDANTKNFALEDPALFFYLRNLNWDELRQRCGFRESDKDYEFDIALSFAGENRELAKCIEEQLRELDISVFYDRNYEDNYLGGPWSKHFADIFVNRSRLVVALLDRHHHDKVWPTFERDCFRPRVADAEVIPVHLDDTIFAGVPSDLVSIHFQFDGEVSKNQDRIIDDIVLRVAAKLDAL
ncbi:TIR domain-containing protein [Sinorhizobium meliloti]|uniref:TIR domain-containing protein n=1 Tax=Rhizobium meliloti TaxID=382 RepID=UPI000FD8F03A|nr:TIR domain-containing protein [Sinorhizobium meliloti]RVI03189.1 TIR domain-containing protein [Sinorhizobium meliloti]